MSFEAPPSRAHAGARIAPVAAIAAMALGALWTAPPASAAETKTATAESGAVRVELTYTEVNEFTFRDVRVKITRAGQTVIDQPVRRPCRSCLVNPNNLPPEGPVSIQEVDGNPAEPEVFVEFYTGGAHCCSWTYIYSWRPEASTYVSAWRFWGNVGYSLRDLDRDGVPELNSADDRFAYAFTCYVCSRFPPRIWRFRGGRFVNATLDFRPLIVKDAARLRRDYLRARKEKIPDVKGILAAYLAEKYLLGQGAGGERVLRQALRRGDLDRHNPGDFCPCGRAYLTKLHKFLKRLGYIP